MFLVVFDVFFLNKNTDIFLHVNLIWYSDVKKGLAQECAVNTKNHCNSN